MESRRDEIFIVSIVNEKSSAVSRGMLHCRDCKVSKFVLRTTVCYRTGSGSDRIRLSILEETERAAMISQVACWIRSLPLAVLFVPPIEQ
jgi:hypothetical protein